VAEVAAGVLATVLPAIASIEAVSLVALA